MLQLEAANVQVGARADSKEDAIRQVAGLLVRSGAIEPGYAESMLAREKVANTYLGKGVAIPHGLPKDRELIKRTSIAVLQVPGGVSWQPGETAHIIVGIAARSDEHIDVLSNLTDLLYDDRLVERLAITGDPGEMVRALSAPRSEAAPAADAADLESAVEATMAGAHGLHARPATAFVEAAKGFAAQVLVRHGTKTADGKSLAALLKLGVRMNDRVTISAQGPDADAALAALKALIEAGEAEEISLAGPAHGWTPRSVGATVPGAAASPGLAIGRLRLLRQQKIVVERTAKDPAWERERLRDAIATARAELQDLYEDVAKKSGKGGAAIFLAHAEFLADPGLIRRTEERIAAGESAGWAWQQTIEAEAAGLAALDDPLLAGRATDLRDVGTRVLRRLAGNAGIIESEPDLPDEPVLLLAEDLTPSDAAGLDPARVLGFCTAGGGPTSHAAIIARSLGIPAVVGAGPAVLHQRDGAIAVLDGDDGFLYVDPSEEDLRAARQAQGSLAGQREAEHRTRYQPALTTDGVRIEVVANAGLSKEAAQAVEAGGEGIGLMRSELLFLERDAPPSEEEQYAAYKEAVDALRGLPLIVRTLDIGGDKAVPYLDMPHEENPFLGVRGIRLCLAHPDLFKTQLRAIFRAAAHGPVKIMYPMVATLEDLHAARAITEEVRRELDAEEVEVGIMIEVPSAVLMAPELARHVDFFSIGTNDLTQYVLAMDRGHPQLARQADGLHPAVLRMIDQAVRAAAGTQVWVGVCGGMAGDPLGAVILVGLGVTELSVSIPSIAAIKARVRTVSMRDARELARRALACESAGAVRALVRGRGNATS